MARRQLAIALLTASACACAGPADDEVISPAGPALMEWRLVHDAPAADRERVEYNGETLYLDPRVVISDPDLEVVRPFISDDRLSFDLQLSPEGSARFHQATGENIGKRLAILIENRVRAAPVINTAIGSPSNVTAIGSVDVSGDEAERIAGLIRARWPEREGVKE